MRSYIRRVQFEARIHALELARLLGMVTGAGASAGSGARPRTAQLARQPPGTPASGKPAFDSFRHRTDKIPAHQALRMMGMTPPRKKGGGSS